MTYLLVARASGWSCHPTAWTCDCVIRSYRGLGSLVKQMKIKLRQTVLTLLLVTASDYMCLRLGYI